MYPTLADVMYGTYLPTLSAESVDSLQLVTHIQYVEDPDKCSVLLDIFVMEPQGLTLVFMEAKRMANCQGRLSSHQY
jgi:hypothetical protein